MMKRLGIAALALFVTTVAAYGLFVLWQAGAGKPWSEGRVPSAPANRVPGTGPIVPPSADAASVGPEQGANAPASTEIRAAAPVPAALFPDPTVNLTGGTLGRLRVPGTDGIGDVHQVQFHLPTDELFMAVTEPDGLRSVWRMKDGGKPERVFAATAGAGDIVLFAGSRGELYVQHNNPCALYRSEDGFRTWEMAHKEPCLFWSMADDGKGTVYATLHDWNAAVLYRSTDDGRTWAAWKDFQALFPEYAVPYADGDNRFKLRHLHDVLYDPQTGQIVVGTGDVARFAFASKDGGDTWQKVWDEGFTSHVRMPGSNKYLLGPDQLYAHGLVEYDANNGDVTERWNPGQFGYAGYAYSLAAADGVYYAAFHTESNEVAEVVPKFGVVVSPDGERWYRFLEWGPLGHHARTDVWLAPAPGRMYVSVNGALYAFRLLDRVWFGGRVPFSS